MDTQNTFLHNLSSVLQTALTSLQTSDLVSTGSELLSALQEKPDLTQIDLLVSELTSIPLHPYDNLLWNHFEPDHKFKTIDDIEDPGDIPAMECLEYITQKEKEVGKTIFHNLTCCPEQRLTSVFETVSGDRVVCCIEKQKNYLEFFEMLRQIPPETVTVDNYQTIFNKILAEYIRVI